MKTKDLKILLFVPLLVFASCKGQIKKESQQLSLPIVQSDTTYTPKYNVKVNKQYDDSGHLMRYDSSYSYSYTSPRGKQSIKDDSIYKKFREYFQKNYSDFFNPPIQDMFYQDSLFKYDFFNNDFFMKRFEMNNEIFSKIYHRMDSLKSDFMRRNYPDGQQIKK